MSLVESPANPQDFFREQDRQRDSFRIRGHHLKFFYRITDGETPEDVADSIMDAAILNSKPDYTIDVLGKTPTETKETREMMVKLFERFRGLPPQHPVEIIETGDGICSSCAKGDHCLKPESWKYEEPILDLFLKAVNSHNRITIPEIQIPQIEQLGFLKIIKTTKGAVEQVFREYPWLMLQQSIENELRRKN